jgi:hypothetical protein
MARFITTAGPIYFRHRDKWISGSHETTSQREIGELCLLPGVILEGSDEHNEWLKRHPAPQPEDHKRKGKHA